MPRMRGSVLCHCNKGNRYSSSWAQTCSWWKDERRIVTRGYLHLRPLPVLLVDRLSAIRPRSWMHGAETPRGHRLPVLAERPSKKFRSGRWIVIIFVDSADSLSLFLVSFPLYVPVRDTIYEWRPFVIPWMVIIDWLQRSVN